MGLWDWVRDSLTGNPRQSPAEERSNQSVRGGTDEATVATLDPASEHDEPGREAPPERWYAPADVTLTEPAPPERPNLRPEERAFENLLISHFDGHDLKMPPLLHAAEDVLARLRDRKCNMAAVAKEISADQVVAAAVLRMANSPLYRGMNKITAVQPAIVRLGVKALRTLMMHESLRAAMFQDRGASAELARMMWERSLAGACTMRGLSKFTNGKEEDAHLIGLLHDIGSVIVLRVAHDDHVFGRDDIEVDSFEYLCFECHQEFGELVAESWKLPGTLKTLISNHHAYPEPDDPLRTERLQIQLSDMINAMLGYGPPASYDLLNSRVVADLGLSERSDFVAFLDDLPAHLEENVAVL